VVIYPDRFWANALRAPRSCPSGRAAISGASRRIRAAIAFATWATFAVCFALIASGAL
jgi:hypothetical protein